MNFSKLIKKYFKSTEEVVSMFLGLVIVVVVIGLIFNFFQKRKGTISIPGTSDINITDQAFENNSNQEIVGITYEVVKGDSLWKIALNKYNNGYAWVEIAKLNNIKSPYFLEIGQKLSLPTNIQKNEVAVEKNQESKISIGEYSVVKNDNLWKLALRAYGDGYQWVKIWQENKSKIYDPNKLEIGMLLTIPSIR